MKGIVPIYNKIVAEDATGFTEQDLVKNDIQADFAPINTPDISKRCNMTKCMDEIAFLAQHKKEDGVTPMYPADYDIKANWDQIKSLQGCKYCDYNEDLSKAFKSNSQKKCNPSRCKDEMMYLATYKNEDGSFVYQFNYDIEQNWNLIKTFVGGCQNCEYDDNYKLTFKQAAATKENGEFFFKAQVKSLSRVVEFIKSPSFEQNLKVYFQFDSIFRNDIDLWLYDKVFKEFRQFSVNDDNSEGKANLLNRLEITRRVKVVLDRMMPKFKEFEEALYQAEEFPLKSTYIDFATKMRVIEMYMTTYSNHLMSMYENRRYSFFNYLIYLVRPHYERIFEKQVIERWRKALSKMDADKAKIEFDVFWSDLRKKIISLFGLVWQKANETLDSL